MRKKQPCDNHHRVIAVLLEALGGTYTISRKQLVEMDWNPQVYRQDNYDGSVTLAVVKERT